MAKLKGKKKYRRRLYTFLYCLLVSILIWGLITLGNTHQDRISLKVLYRTIPTDLAIVNPLPESIDVIVRSDGFNLLFNRMFKSWPTVEIPVDPPRPRGKGGKQFHFTLQIRPMMRDLNAQLGMDVELAGVQPDSLVVVFDQLATKTVPVKLKLQLSYKKNFGLAGIPHCTPSEIDVSGPAKRLHDIDSVAIEVVNTEKLSGSFKQEIPIKRVAGFQYSTTFVMLEVPVERLLEKILHVRITPINVPDSLDIQLIADHAEIYVAAPVSMHQRLKEQDFSIVMDYQQREPTLHKGILICRKKPDWVRVTRIVPQTAEFIIKVNRQKK
jgi:hypothetical protein